LVAGTDGDNRDDAPLYEIHVLDGSICRLEDLIRLERYWFETARQSAQIRTRKRGEYTIAGSLYENGTWRG